VSLLAPLFREDFFLHALPLLLVPLLARLELPFLFLLLRFFWLRRPLAFPFRFSLFQDLHLVP
jgi:hypothetical protein